MVDAPTTEDVFTLSSPCEPDGTGELIRTGDSNRSKCYLCC